MNYHLNKIMFFACVFFNTQAKVTIFSRYFGQPEFIKYQYSFFKKNLLDEYEFVVIDDSNKINISNKIKNECEKYDIIYIRIPRSVFDHPKLPITSSYVTKGSASFECSVSVQYVYDNYVLPSDNICVIIDNDIFLTAPFSIEKYLGESAFAYVPQSRGTVDYMLANFLIFNPSIMPEKSHLNFNMGTILGNNTDSGGYTYFYLLNHKNIGKIVSSCYLHDTPSLIKDQFISNCPTLFTSKSWRAHYFIDKELFLHIRMGSNWSNNPDYPKMMAEVNFLFDKLLNKSYSNEAGL